ncbi:MAG: GTP 3',8-cyclase MoaA [Candidatus Omnitrophota bacterium]|nr:GTP 3',8-cyclase MoaA [Candidatus Omnitrophota bacterium]
MSHVTGHTSQKNPNTNQGPRGAVVTDQFQRPLHDVRISVIDRCNFRCPYCMPEDEYSHAYTFLDKQEWLTFGEILRLAKIFVRLGAAKIRLTGGEPLLRPDLPELIRQMTKINGIEDLALTTNGWFLAEKAAELKAAGLHRLTVSLDTLSEKTFQTMSGGKGSVGRVLDSIGAAALCGFSAIKINTVVQKGVNDATVLDLVERFKGTGHVLRFIEYMDVGTCNHWQNTQVVPSRELYRIINERFPLRPVEGNYFGEVAERYEFTDGTGEIGFISSVTQPFCGTCTRMRLSTDGKIYTCLFAGEGTDLRGPIRDGASDDELYAIVKKVWQGRMDKYSENRWLFRSLKATSKKIEMFQIGG